MLNIADPISAFPMAAFFEPASLGIMIPIICMLIPIVAILTRHQQRMAEIIHANRPQNTPDRAEIDSLRREIQELKQIVHQQAISMDTWVDRQTKLAQTREPAISDRLTGG
jgi:hypothetical protein